MLEYKFIEMLESLEDCIIMFTGDIKYVSLDYNRTQRRERYRLAGLYENDVYDAAPKRLKRQIRLKIYRQSKVLRAYKIVQALGVLLGSYVLYKTPLPYSLLPLILYVRVISMSRGIKTTYMQREIQTASEIKSHIKFLKKELCLLGNPNSTRLYRAYAKDELEGLKRECIKATTQLEEQLRKPAEKPKEVAEPAEGAIVRDRKKRTEGSGTEILEEIRVWSQSLTPKHPLSGALTSLLEAGRDLLEYVVQNTECQRGVSQLYTIILPEMLKVLQEGETLEVATKTIDGLTLINQVRTEIIRTKKELYEGRIKGYTTTMEVLTQELERRDGVE